MPYACGYQMLCEERDRLKRLYLDAIATLAEDGKAIANKEGAEWRRATEGARAACQAILGALNQHRTEHGC